MVKKDRPTKRKAKKGRKLAPITLEQAESMFQHWCQVRSIIATAKKFKVSTSTVNRLKKRNDWQGRFDQVMEEIGKKSVKQAAADIQVQVKMAREILAHVGEYLINAGRDKYLEPSISDFVKLATYIDQHDVGGRTEKSDLIIAIIEQIERQDDQSRSLSIADAVSSLDIGTIADSRRPATVGHSQIPASKRRW